MVSPVKNMLQPTMGMKKLDVLDTNLKGRSRWNRVKMSCSTELLCWSRICRASAKPELNPINAQASAEGPPGVPKSAQDLTDGVAGTAVHNFLVMVRPRHTMKLW